MFVLRVRTAGVRTTQACVVIRITRFEPTVASVFRCVSSYYSLLITQSCIDNLNRINLQFTIN